MNWQQPDYRRGNLVNLMSSLITGSGGSSLYPSLVQLQPHHVEAKDRVVLFVVDGLGFEFIDQHPNSFLREHTQCTLSSVFPSTTASAITTLMSGLAPRQHGLTGWFTYLAALGTVMAVLPFQPRCGGSFARPAAQAREIFDWVPLYDTLKRKCYLVLPENISDSVYSMTLGGSAQRMGYDNLENMFEHVTRILSNTGERSFTYIYWPMFDMLSHQFGVYSDRVARHYTELDGAFANFAATIDPSSTLVLATADHGLIDTAADRTIFTKDHPELAATLLLPLCGEPRVAYCYIRHGAEKKFLDYIEGYLNHACVVKRSSELIATDYFGEGVKHPDLHRRVGDYVLLMKDNYVLKDRLFGETPFAHVGVHGGLTSAEMTVPLVNIAS